MDTTDTDRGPTTAESISAAHRQISEQLAIYGSYDRWPTLSLLPNQFPVCSECGQPRHKHKLVGTQRAGTTKGLCAEFRALIDAKSPRKRERR